MNSKGSNIHNVSSQPQQVVTMQIEKPISLVPVGLKEAALDSPSFRATAVHFCEQMDIIEKWLDGFTKSIVKVLHETVTLETLIAGILTSSVPPPHLSEAALDHDYTLLALKRYKDVAREYWGTTILGVKRMEPSIVDPIRAFSQGDLRSFKETRRNLDQSQKQFDGLQSRYSSQARTKEPSSLREDAFQLHEARKAYLKASMDFSVLAPQIRMSLDKLMVKIASDQWREIRNSREGMNGPIARWGQDIERIQGWSHEMEGGEKSFRREIQATRRQIEETAEVTARPSRELEDYSIAASTFGSKGPSSNNIQTSLKPGYSKAEKQGWLNIRTASGKPARSVWLRRWFYVKNGIFGWLVQGSRSGGVEESERIGVLLCSIRPTIADERRFCFEVMTKDTTLTLQADSQDEVVDWIRAFEVAKQKALEDPASTDSPGLPGSNAQDAAFAITPPSAPEFAASTLDFSAQQRGDDTSKTNIDRSVPLPLNEEDVGPRNSVDISSNRRSTGLDVDGDRRDHSSRIKQKLDLHRKSVGTSINPAAGLVPSSPVFPSAGIASLISSGHNIMPVGPGVNPPSSVQDNMSIRDLPVSTLAPSTLVNPPAPTNLSTTAVVVNGDRGIGMGRTDATGGMPSGLMANLWGTSNWGYMNRLERGEISSPSGTALKNSNPSSPQVKASGLPKNRSNESDPSLPSHQIEFSHKGGAGNNSSLTPEFPNYFPVQLRTQEAQFRLLFPNVRSEEKVLLVFRATWNPNNQQDFPGRVYVTAKQIYFYSNHYGLVLTTSLQHGSISEVTAAPGRDYDFIFLHLKESSNRSQSTRVTIKIFLEPFRLLQRRLSFLVRNFNSEQPPDIESIMKHLIRLESDDSDNNPSPESWDELFMRASVDEGCSGQRYSSQNPSRDLRTAVRIEKGLYGYEVGYEQKQEVTKFKLPRQPVVYVPPGTVRVAVEKVFEISPKAMFHVMFGDKSAVWQLLYFQRRAQRIKQTSWTQPDQGHMRREFEYETEYANVIGQRCHATVVDYQMINVLNDHLCYVVTDRKTPFHLPWHDSFTLLSKVVITHVAKSRCKLAIYTSVDWSKPPVLVKSFIDRRAIADLDQNALDLIDVITDQVRKLGPQSRTRKSVQIFGQVGMQTQAVEFTSHDETLIPRAQGLRRHYNVADLFIEFLISLSESIITTSMQWCFAILRWVWKTFSANSLILVILALSVAANIFSSSRTTSQWWSDRKAGQYMTRLGVGPNLVMSKAVYLRDLDLATASRVEVQRIPERECFEIFHNTISSIDLDAPNRSARRPVRVSSSQAMNARLSKTMQTLGLYRHDLLVAMRVVNSIERETVQAEWEHWIVNENLRCHQLNSILNQNRTGTSGKHTRKETDNSQQIFSTYNRDHRAVQAWYQDYCESCRREQDTQLQYDVNILS